MSEPLRFLTCEHCGLPHESGLGTCPFTGRAIDASRPSIAPPPDPFIGQVLDGRYAVRELLGRGGMGSVYRALHTALDREVAVKILLGKEARSAGRLLREARAAAAIRHDHVVAVHDVAALDDGTPFLVMELLDGESLDQRLLARGALEIVEAIDITLQLLAGLEAVHQTGVVHRDVKPANVFLLAGDAVRVKLLDFSISKLSEASQLTRTGEIVGTPRYLSPEQARGLPDVDARVDVWAVGVLLHEMLTGETPFDAETVSGLVTSILVDDPRPPSATRPEVPPALDRVVTVALSKSPDDRYASATAMRLALARLRRRAETDDTLVDGEGDEVLGTIPRFVEPSTLVDSQPPERGGRLEETHERLKE
ncbi:MAG: serine/threonine protein kinase [Sandaracinaceae bacterium]|nr:serine/threonine protein kinase [Sandaracinaceae bacterium]